MTPAAPPDARPRDAATVVLIRDRLPSADQAMRSAGVEVFLMRRNPQVGFLGGMHVFPGGKVDAGDRDASLADLIEAEDLGRAPERLAEDLSVADAVALFVAAFRETYEEAGLIPGIPPGSAAGLVTARAHLEHLGFAETLRGLGVRIDLDAMEPFSRWITPTIETRRFDARFFLAAAPPHQVGKADGSETDRALFLSPRVALERHAAGDLALLPPTWMTLHQLSQARDVEEALALARASDTPALQPEVVQGAKGFTLCFPGDPAHSIATRALPGPTRLTFQEGRWLNTTI